MPLIEVTDLAFQVDELNSQAAKPVLLLHGWPDDASTWDQVAPMIGDAGYRVINFPQREAPGCRRRPARRLPCRRAPLTLPIPTRFP